jgi:DNA-binding SARP family transcriptional activator
MHVRIALLGTFEVETGRSTVRADDWPRRHASALVKLLALQPGRRLHREQVIDALWPDLTVMDAAPRLHKAAHFARRTLGDPASVVLADETVALWPASDVSVDALGFEALAERAVTSHDRATAARAIELYRGDLLPQDPYADWLEAPRERLRQLYRDLLRLTRRWESLTTADPADEEAHLELMRQQIADGAPRSAIRQYERLERALGRELGVAPGREAKLLRERAMVATVAAPAAADAGTRSGRPPVSRPVAAPPAQALVGRAHALARIDGLLDRLRSGSGQALFVTGPAGTGKSSLLLHTLHRAAGMGMRVGYGTAAAVEGGWPFGPILEALADLCRRHPTLLDGLDDSLRAEIERSLAGEHERRTHRRGDQRLFVAAVELVRLAAAGPGAVLLLDDAHAADDATLRLAHYLARSTIEERVLIVLAHRLGPLPAGLDRMRSSLVTGTQGTAILTGTLDRVDTARLVRQRVPDADDATVDWIWQASGGVPFIAGELAHVAGTGEVSAATVSSALLAGVPEEISGALRSVAVLGMSFSTDEFVEATSRSEEVAFDTLDRALDDHLIVRADSGFRFRHQLLRDALLDPVPPHRLRALHRRAAEALQRLADSPSRIGRHLLLAGRVGEAVPHVLQAAHAEAAMGAYRDALASLDSIGEPVARDARVTWLALRADLLSACGEAGAVDAYRAALGATEDPELTARLRARLARAATYAGDLATAEIALDGLTLDGSDDTGLLLARGELALFKGDLEAADQAAVEARRRLALRSNGSWQLFDLVALQGLVAHSRGQWFDLLRSELRRGVDRPDLAVGIFDSHLCVAEYLLYGPTPYDEVLELARSLRVTAERAGALRAVAFATALLGEAALLRGDLELAAAELGEAAALHHDLVAPAGEAHSMERLAEVELAHGNREAAMLLLQRALPLARWSMVAMHLLQRIFGTMIAAAPDAAAGRAIVDRAEATIGRDDYCVFCAIMLAVPAAVACARVGDLDDARRHLRVAEKSAGLWEGTAWQAALLEARGHLARAEGDEATGAGLLTAAAELFETSGQPLDAARCRQGT